MLSKYGNCMYASAQTLKQAENRLFLQIKSGRILDILCRVFNKTIIPLALCGYKMVLLVSCDDQLRYERKGSYF